MTPGQLLMAQAYTYHAAIPQHCPAMTACIVKRLLIQRCIHLEPAHHWQEVQKLTTGDRAVCKQQMAMVATGRCRKLCLHANAS